MSFISWFLFCMFGGIGIPALPLDLFYDFFSRPKQRKLEEMVEIKKQIIINSQKVKHMALDLKDCENKDYHKRFFFSGEKREYNDKLVKLRAATYMLDKDYRMFKIQTELNEEMVCHYYFGFVLACLFSVISIAWFIHMYFFYKKNKNKKDFFTL